MFQLYLPLANESKAGVSPRYGAWMKFAFVFLHPRKRALANDPCLLLKRQSHAEMAGNTAYGAGKILLHVLKLQHKYPRVLPSAADAQSWHE